MQCIICGHEFVTHSGISSCPNCGHQHTVMHAVIHNAINNQPLPTLPQKSTKFFNSKKSIFTALLAILLIISLIGSLSALTLTRSRSNQATEVKNPPESNSNTKTSKPPDDETITVPENEAPTGQEAPVSDQPETATRVQTLQAIIDTINTRLERYDIIITLTPTESASTYSTWSVLSESDYSTLDTLEEYLIEEFSKLPVDMVENSGLQTIGLVKNLNVSGTFRAAAPAPSTRSMLYDIHSLVNSGNEYARTVISHEYWHYLDYAIQNDYFYKDAEWSKCNPSGFTYGAGGITAYDPASGYTAAFNPKPGFITTYSTYGIEEDRAELFSWMIYDPAKVRNLNDTGINCKINRLTTLARQLSPNFSF